MIEWLKAWLAPELRGKAAEDLTGFRFDFNVPLPTAVCVLVVAAAGLGVALYYWPKVAKLPPARRSLVVALRALALSLALFMLFDPCIVARRIRPGDQYVVLLFDDSKSMKVEGSDGLARGERVVRAYEAARAEFEEKLTRRYRLARYRFGEAPAPLRSTDDLEFDERESDLAGAIEGALRDLDGIDVAGVVLFTDGIQQSEANPALPHDFAPRAPVFAVGSDLRADADPNAPPDRWRDLALDRLTVARPPFDKSPVSATLRARADGLDGERVVAEIVRGERVVAFEAYRVEGDEHEREIRLEFLPAESDFLEYEARVRLATTGQSDGSVVVGDISADGRDRVLQNNSRRFLVDDRPREFRILYAAGRPDWENKFVRRALEDDDRLKLTSLIRMSRAERKFVFRGRRSAGTANPLFEGFGGDAEDQPRWDESVFVRLGVRGTELERGFPTLPEELFPFHALAIGDLEYEFFSREQIELIREFVRKRGGTLLALGGPHSFLEGGYDGTLFEEMLPVVVGPTGGEGHDLAEEFRVKPTADGILAGAWALDPNPEANLALWNSMPSLHGANRFQLVRPGADVLAGAENAGGGSVPFFATQRFGEGRTAALATGSTWPWKMRLDETDGRHERFWRQLLRNLVQDVPEPVRPRSRPDRYIAARDARLEYLVRDAAFDAREELRVSILAKQPSGVELPLAVEESIEETGVYAADFTPLEPGLHRVVLEAFDGEDRAVARFEDGFLVSPDDREFERARFDGAFLEDLAARSGGKVFPLDRLTDVADAIPWEATERSDEVRVRLWKFPGFFAALVGMMATEWYLRRRGGYA